MQAKPIVYDETRFRSRIEVRWSIVFSTLGVEWRYELRHYDFGLSRPWLQDECEFQDYIQEAQYYSDHDSDREFYADMYRQRNQHDMYLPDFFLPEFNHWVEIKGKAPNFEEVNKARNLTHHTKQPVTILWSYIPDPNAIKWGECSDVYGDKNNISILGHLAITYGIPAMQKAFTVARQTHFNDAKHVKTANVHSK